MKKSKFRLMALMMALLLPPTPLLQPRKQLGARRDAAAAICPLRRADG